MIQGSNNKGDTLDNAAQEYSRVKSFTTQNDSEIKARQDLMLKNLYRHQLDEVMFQKNQQKRLEKQKQLHQKQLYNERVAYGKQAERLKDLSYKNYYQLLLNNQANITKNHHGYNYDRDNLKDKLIQNSLQEGRNRNQSAYQAQKTRLDGLAGQVNEKQYRNAQDNQLLNRQKQQYNKTSFTPSQIAKFERERKMMEMSKYKHDLDSTSPMITGKTRLATGQQVVNNGSFVNTNSKYSTIRNNNDFNVYKQVNHNPMVNPMPYNIQNPYILRQFQRLDQQNNNNQGSIQSNVRNNIFN